MLLDPDNEVAKPLVQVQPNPLRDVAYKPVIYWVNSFSSPYCLLASSPADFKDGVILCELASKIKGTATPREVAKDCANNASLAKRNIGIALDLLKDLRLPPRISKLSPEDVYESEDSLYDLLVYMKSVCVSRQNPGPGLDDAYFSISDVRQASTEDASSVSHPKETIDSGVPILIADGETRSAADRVGSYEAGNCNSLEPELFASVEAPPKPVAMPVKHPHPQQSEEHATPRLDGNLSQEDRPLQMASGRFGTVHERSQVEEKRVDTRTKQKLLKWFEDISLIKQNAVSAEEFPGYCRNGVLLADLIQRLEGVCGMGANLSEQRQSELKGINRNPRTQTAILSNLKKCLEHLRKYEKMNARYWPGFMSSSYLWSMQGIIEGNMEVIWGLLDDIWHVFNPSTVPATRRQNSRHKEELATSPTAKSESVTQRPLPLPRAQPSSRQNPGFVTNLSEPPEPSYLATRPTPPPQPSPPRSALRPAMYNTASTRRDSSIQSPHSAIKVGQRNSKGSMASYSRLHSRSPIKTNYYKSAHELRRGMVVTPNGGRPNELLSAHRRSINASLFSEGLTKAPSKSALSPKAVRGSGIKMDGSILDIEVSFPHVSEEAEKLTRGWLKLLNFTTTSSQENDTLLKSPFRNGVLLCEVRCVALFHFQLAELLEKVTVRKLLHPTTVAQAQHNIESALRLFEERKAGRLPGRYVSNNPRAIEGILRGERDVIWGLLSAIREMYPQTDQQSKTCFHLLNTGLPYSLPELRRLETSILSWLQALHLVRIPQQNKYLTLLDIEHEVRNGTLLCELAAILSRNQCKIAGVITDPRSSASSLSNIRKACELMRRLPRINKRFLWCEKEIFGGDRGVILGLFEDLHRFYDGIAAPSSPTPYPYYGREDQRDLPLSPYRSSTEQAFSPAPEPEHAFVQAHREDTSKHPQSPLDEFYPSSQPEMLPADPQHSVPMPYPCPVNPVASRRKPSSFGAKRDADIGTLATRPSRSLVPTIYQSPSPATPTAANHTKPVASPEAARHDQGDVLRSPRTGETSAGRLLEWLRRLKVTLPKGLDLEARTLTWFKDGVLLGQIVSTLERRKLEGINERPRSSAAALHNIRKVLEALKGKKAIPMSYLYAEDDILKGKRETIVGLLNGIKAAYPNVAGGSRPGNASYTNPSNCKKPVMKEGSAKKEQGVLFKTYSDL